ncbi:MAG: prolipoprotein diacylglyceryl transferase [Candidatus Eremiobacterota bacterium]
MAVIRFDPIQSIPLGPLKVTSHGLFIFLGALLTLFWARARTPPEYREAMEGALPWMTVSGVLGARLAWVVINPGEIHSPLDVIAFWQGGLVSYGGMLGALTAWTVYGRVYRLPVGRLTDALAPAGLLGWGVGRLGCFMSWVGEPGSPTTLPWGVTAPEIMGARHPVMLYQSFMLILGAGLVVWLARRTGRSAAGLSLGVYGLSRFVGDLFRDWTPDWLGTVSMVIALALAAAGLIYALRVPARPVSKI